MVNPKVAVVQPLASYGDEEWRNAERCLEYLDEAALTGARLICFPEGYPGPCHGPLDGGGRWTTRPMDALRERARRRRVYVSASELEPNPSLPDTYALTHKLIGPDGAVLANYRRVQPDHQHLNAYLMGGRRHVLPGDEIMVVPTELGRIGLLICSELWVPELCRVLMLRGADMILAPINGSWRRSHMNLHESWMAVARARACENLLYVVQTVNIFAGNPQVRGRAAIIGPEGALCAREDPGIAAAVLDMDRLHWLRTHYVSDELLATPPSEDFEECRTRPGQCHDRRPELYKELMDPQPDAYDYLYFQRGLGTWEAEYDKIRSWRWPAP
jgi:predicted amidohydrolase